MRPGVRIGIDVGSVRVGVARSDPSGLLATPVETVARTFTEVVDPTDEDVCRVVALIAQTEAIEVVVGLPQTLAGSEGPAAAKARQYAAVLARSISPVTVRLVDERLTTVAAHRALRESGVAGRRSRAVVDQVAAVLILQSALDEERSSGRPPGELVADKRRKPRRKDVSN